MLKQLKMYRQTSLTTDEPAGGTWGLGGRVLPARLKPQRGQDGLARVLAQGAKRSCPALGWMSILRAQPPAPLLRLLPPVRVGKRYPDGPATPHSYPVPPVAYHASKNRWRRARVPVAAASGAGKKRRHLDCVSLAAGLAAALPQGGRRPGRSRIAHTAIRGLQLRGASL